MFNWPPLWYTRLLARKTDTLQQTVADVKFSIREVEHMLWGELLSLVIIMATVVSYYYIYAPLKFDLPNTLWAISLLVLVLAKFISLRRLNKKLRLVYAYFNVR